VTKMTKEEKLAELQKSNWWDSDGAQVFWNTNLPTQERVLELAMNQHVVSIAMEMMVRSKAGNSIEKGEPTLVLTLDREPSFAEGLELGNQADKFGWDPETLTLELWWD